MEETTQPKEESVNIDIDKLYDIKGHPGLYLLDASLNRARMAKFTRILDGKQIQASHDNTTCLGNLAIMINQSEHSVKAKTALENLFSLFPIKLPEYKNEEHAVELMKVVVPNHDESKFKHYHMKKLLKWAAEIRVTQTMLNASTPAVAEVIKEENTTNKEIPTDNKTN